MSEPDDRDEQWLSRTLAGSDDPRDAEGERLLAGVRRRRRAARRRRLAAGGAMTAVAATAVVVALVTGGDGTATDRGNPAAGFPEVSTPYDGPLVGVDGAYGAAGAVVDCEPVEGGAERDTPYAEGATSDSVRGALETAYSEGLFLSLPDIDLGAARVEPDRVLLTYAPAGRTVAALVFHDGPATEGAGGPGWYLESWARCDISAFPSRDAAALGYQVWRDAEGEPVPVTTLSSGPGPEHCGWDRFTFLYLDDQNVYVRAPDRTLRSEVEGVYTEGSPLPADAVPTGFRRDGRQLWRTPDDRQVYVGTPDRVEVWPRFLGGCE